MRGMGEYGLDQAVAVARKRAARFQKPVAVIRKTSATYAICDQEDLTPDDDQYGSYDEHGYYLNPVVLEDGREPTPHVCHNCINDTGTCRYLPAAREAAATGRRGRCDHYMFYD